MRLRQVALVAEDLHETEKRLEHLLGLDPGYHDPGIIKFGLDNWVATIGDTFLEVVSPVQENTTAGRYLERRGGDGGYMVILQVEDLEAARSRLEGVGARIVWTARGDGDDGEVTQGLHVHPRDCGGAILSVDVAEPTDAWVWAGAGWQRKSSPALAQICGVEIQTEDPRAMSRRWCELLGVEASEGTSPDGRPAWILDLPGGDLGTSSTPGSVRFVAAEDGRGDGVSAVDFRVTAPEEVARRAGDLGLDLEGEGSARWLDDTGVRFVFVD